ncbi:tRNA preQ1(34) S-adenosylmethionine ribosyltransferase-isomerase QueA [Hyphococcus luteus]|uniref:S-adenosylmethionine:tRNA ribosyltransferase-isomerase n=1 Tax=Hyphococcus luteus TaxID=2058213 RepID=A0A2S7K3Q4_9PROT|nr:tRNA preQ1(34) S-adenosylmethionine ribosyltransferase-isomerase QueA [Marinicaulis flavus]PQA87116.1 tRNA preQ1(34) S-adenosylmethionine ribosyltransferase-isomerase QueA [Marinicaulis flavus]
MRVDLFDFELPPERIAMEPVSPRDSARLLCVRPEGLEDRIVRDLPGLLRPGDLLVANDTKVIPAQLFGQRPPRDGQTGGAPVAVEATLHKDLGRNVWRAFVRPAKRLKEGDAITFAAGLAARVIARDGAEADLQFETQGDHFFAALEKAGVMPLPPYIARKRPAGEDDKASYQTMFADEAGSVAAPTAGLHFTPDLIAALRDKGVEQTTVTLHVGAGTFLPVTAEDTADHKMHAEWGEITHSQAAKINEARAAGGRIIAVGTTSLRLLESAAGEDGKIAPFADETDIFITPGYRFKAADMLMTNFHLPRSTLFMLVSAFAGTDRMKAAYAHAVEQGYRFYSYGDACLLERI